MVVYRTTQFLSLNAKPKASIFKIVFTGLFLGLAQTSALGFSLDAFSSVQSATGRQTVFENKFDEVNEIFTDKPTDSDSGLNNTVIGNSRHLKLTIDPATNTTNEASLLISTSNNLLTLSTDTNIAPTALIAWNGLSTIDFNNPTLNSNLNLNLEADGDGDDSIGIGVNFSDQGGQINLRLFDGTNSYTYSKLVPQTASPQNLYFDFQTYKDNLVNINNIQYASMTITGPTAYDVELDFLQTAKEVPFEFSPGLGLILGGGLFGFLRLRKKIS